MNENGKNILVARLFKVVFLLWVGVTNWLVALCVLVIGNLVKAILHKD